MDSTVLTPSPRAHGCRAWGGCTPGDRCAEHRDSDPVPLAELLFVALDQLTPPRRPRLRVIQGGKR
ncbi:hypothetical protein [Micromonospora coerulea]|uniref:hypothetical protein n=1 Tax=Micromonospora coerulea TaxID=47856 RepID=UPI00190817A6|nr:hypothetical protein [Micromonospora veneta]